MSHIVLYYTYNLTINKKKVFKQKILRFQNKANTLGIFIKKGWTKAIYDDNDGMTFWEIFDCCFKCHWRNPGPDIGFVRLNWLYSRIMNVQDIY